MLGLWDMGEIHIIPNTYLMLAVSAVAAAVLHQLLLLLLALVVVVIAFQDLRGLLLHLMKKP